MRSRREKQIDEIRSMRHVPEATRERQAVRLEAMTDAEYEEHRRAVDARWGGAIARMASEAMRAR
jgi:hypothetical protein